MSTQTTNQIKHYKIVNDSSIKTYLGYLRKQYNAYYHGTQDRPLNMDSFTKQFINYLDAKTKEVIRFNTEVVNPHKLRKGLPVQDIIRKKDKSWSLVFKEGITIKLQYNNAFLDCKGVIYKFPLDTKEKLKDGIYTNCIISMHLGMPVLTLNHSKYRSFKKYISAAELNNMKASFLERRSTTYRVKNYRILDKKIPDTQKASEIRENSSVFVMDIIQFIKTLSGKYCNLGNKTEIPQKYLEYCNASRSCESQARIDVLHSELKAMIIAEFAPYARNEVDIKNLMRALY